MENEFSPESRLIRNNQYYERFASEVKSRSENRDFSKAFDVFLPLVLDDAPILDIGCGTGTHLKEFHLRGLKAIGVEPSEAMRSIVGEQGLESINGSFETLELLDLPPPGGIWCAASLLHVPRRDLDRTFQTLSRLLRQKAPLYFTVRLGEGAKWDRWDDSSGEAARFIQLFKEDELIEGVERAGFKIVQKWIEDSTWGRPSKWISVVAQRL